MKTQEAVVKKLINMCQDQHISINHLAYISGVPPSTVKNIIYGNTVNTGVVTIAKLCNGLEVSMKEFFNDDMFGVLEQEIE